MCHGVTHNKQTTFKEKMSMPHAVKRLPFLQPQKLQQQQQQQEWR